MSRLKATTSAKVVSYTPSPVEQTRRGGDLLYLVLHSFFRWGVVKSSSTGPSTLTHLNPRYASPGAQPGCRRPESRAVLGEMDFLAGTHVKHLEQAFTSLGPYIRFLTEIKSFDMIIHPYILHYNVTRLRRTSSSSSAHHLPTQIVFFIKGYWSESIYTFLIGSEAASSPFKS